MNFKELKNGQNVLVYIPVFKTFYDAKVTEHINGNRFTVTLNRNIEGHEVIVYLYNQNDIDGWFYITDKKQTSSIDFDDANRHFIRNNKAWIFGSEKSETKKIIREGNKVEKSYKKDCYKCKTIFSYTQADTEIDRDSKYVKCPSCGAFITVA